MQSYLQRSCDESITQERDIRALGCRPGQSEARKCQTKRSRWLPHQLNEDDLLASLCPLPAHLELREHGVDIVVVAKLAPCKHRTRGI